MRKLLLTIAATLTLAFVGVGLSLQASANGVAEPAGLIKAGQFNHFNYGRQDRFGRLHVGGRHFGDRGIRRFDSFGRDHGLRRNSVRGLRSNRLGNSRFPGIRGGNGRFR